MASRLRIGNLYLQRPGFSNSRVSGTLWLRAMRRLLQIDQHDVNAAGFQHGGRAARSTSTLRIASRRRPWSSYAVRHDRLLRPWRQQTIGFARR